MNDEQKQKIYAFSGLAVIVTGIFDVKHINYNMNLEYGEEDEKIEFSFLDIASGFADLALSANHPVLSSGYYGDNLT